jgi:cytochrome P450
LSDQYSEVEKVDLLLIMLAAGITTTADLISNAVNALVSNPDQLAMLRQNPDLSAVAVEETLRYDGSWQKSGKC